MVWGPPGPPELVPLGVTPPNPRDPPGPTWPLAGAAEPAWAVPRC